MRFCSPWPRAWIAAPQRRRRAPGATPDGARSGSEAVARRLAHTFAGEAHDGQDLLVARARERAPWVHPGVIARLRLPDVPEARERPLIEDRVTDRARLVILVKARQQRRLIELLAEHVGAEADQARVKAPARGGHQLEQRAVELHDDRVGVLDHQPRTRRRAPPALAAASHRPSPRHAQVRVQHELALEVDEQMLAVGMHALDRAAGQPRGPTVGAVARLGRADQLRHGAFEHRADAVGRVMDRVAFGHQRVGPGQCSAGGEQRHPRLGLRGEGEPPGPLRKPSSTSSAS